jgi:hypothetical protein
VARLCRNFRKRDVLPRSAVLDGGSARSVAFSIDGDMLAPPQSAGGLTGGTSEDLQEMREGQEAVRVPPEPADAGRVEFVVCRLPPRGDRRWRADHRDEINEARRVVPRFVYDPASRRTVPNRRRSRSRRCGEEAGRRRGLALPNALPPRGDGGSCPAPSRRLFPPAGGQNQPSRGAPTTQQFGRLPAGLVERAARRRLHFGRLTRLVPGRLGTSITAPTAPAISAPRTGGAIASRGRETASRWRTLAAARTSP